MKKLLSLIMVVLLVFTSGLFGCGAKNTSGDYVFRLGKTTGEHMGVYVSLYDEIFDEENPELGKKFTMKLDILGMAGFESKDVEEFEKFFKGMSAHIGEDGVELNGYYRLGEEDKKKGTRVYLGGRIDKSIVGEIEFKEEWLEYIIAVYLDKKTLTIVMPVSMDDLFFQLYWYGVDVYDFDADVEEHEIGTHPTKEEIDLINQTYPSKHGGKLFRDFHCLNMGLMKE